VRRILKSSARLAWRLVILIAGLFLLIIGIIMIFTPGPAIVFIPAGLALLATEFEWARRILRRVRPLIDAAIEKAKRKKEEAQTRRRRKKADSAASPSDETPGSPQSPVRVDAYRP
jgi:uncharacterized protein (TIGR02611 family)